MSLLRNFLELKPTDWSDTHYTSSRFCLLNLNTTEYTTVKNDFQNYFKYLNVTDIQRVQHPYAYAMYLVRKEHLRTQDGQDPSECIRYLQVLDSRQVRDVLEYNCDYRRGEVTNLTLRTAQSEGCAVVVKVLKNSYDFRHLRDSNRYPMYVVHYEVEQSFKQYL